MTLQDSHSGTPQNPLTTSDSQDELHKISAKIKGVMTQQRNSFRAGHTLSYEQRVAALIKLKAGIKKHEQALLDALHLDLGKHPTEAYLTEIGFLYEELSLAIKNLRTWMTPRKVKMPMTLWPARGRVLSEPLGQVLIIGAWNYPINLALAPLIGALAAGCVAVIKPSELTPASSDALKLLIEECLPVELCSIILGGPEVSQKLLDERWDHIFFTGSTEVGRIVALAAAKHLTPVTLELGGKSPCIVTAQANIKVAARRIVFGKFINVGQTCVAPDYILVDETVKPDLIKALITEIENNLTGDALSNPQYGKIVNSRHFQRLSKLINPSKVVYGGKTDPVRLQIEPTLMSSVELDDAVMQEEIFGPILPIIGVKDLNEAIDIVRVREKPLALYVFSEQKEEQTRVLHSCSFGGGCINDSLVHLGNSDLPFGGVGHSGSGAYHGKQSYDCFSHQKSILFNTTKIDPKLRYTPWTPMKDKLVRFLFA